MTEQHTHVRTFEVRAQLTKDAAMTGEWTSETTAERKFTEWIGLYARDDVVITLTVRTDGGPPVTLKRWPDAPQGGQARARLR
ncbi:hypothetical protein BX261_7300 [Streptomyces sp. 2321.6]|uniref:hypothetical protein n=1 Tax=Streptomyces sp. 2321.6 TaxID=1938840 RepID=UPI000BB0EA5C|nr:hypothetical protein [Streptomyces sp. 2321.6]PBC72365.1 hypothetical protein BX261_7237 [Streptomyces sp. 2321.6]PBC72426.1 hypothetical protein BX261_7300 [Streptomyces sp. 2321.6]